MIWVVRRPVATWMITIALFVFGLVSYGRLPMNLMPDLNYPTLTIRAEADGYAPEEVEEQVSQKIEEAVGTVQGLSRLESRSRAGLSEVVLSFRWGTDINVAVQDVRERVQRVYFAEDVQRPLILRFDPTLDPILRLALSTDSETNSTLSLMDLRDTAERVLKRELEALDGIAAVQIRGGFEKEIQVLIREDWMSARGITVDQVIETLRRENINMPGGSILEGDREYLVRTINAYTKIEDLKALKIRREDGVEVSLTELAEIREGVKDRNVMGRLNGQEAVELEIYRAADANIVSVSQTIKTHLFGDGSEQVPDSAIQDSRERWRPKKSKPVVSKLPEGVSLKLLEDQAQFVESSIDNLKSTALLGALLAMLILFAFLRNFRATFIISAAIPMSIVVTFAPMYLWDVSLNLMSLGGLALGVGMLVDNAVVVLENIQVQLDNGLERKQAASLGSQEVATAVTASTLTTISVFLPIAFVDGVAGQVFGDLALSVVFSLTASLVVALFFVPMLASTTFTPPPYRGRPSIRKRFLSFSELADSYRKSGFLKGIVFTPWFLMRFMMSFGWELMVTIVMLPLLAFLWVMFRIGGVVKPLASSVALWLAGLFYALYARFEKRYGRFIRPVVMRPGLVIGFAVLSVVVAGPVSAQMGQILLPEMKQGRFAADVELEIGTPLGRTASIMQPIEIELSKMEGVDYVYSILGSDNRVDDRSGSGEHSATFLVGLEASPKQADVEEMLMEMIRNKLQSLDNLKSLTLRRPQLFSFDTPIELVHFNDDLGEMREFSNLAKDTVSNIEGLRDVRTSLAKGYPEVQIRYDRERLRQLDLSSADAARIVREKIQGEKATTLSTGDSRLDLTVRLSENERRSVDQLKSLNINPGVNPEIPLGAVAEFEISQGPSEIRRIDQQRALVLTANIDGFDLAGAATDIQEALYQQGLNGFEISGQSEEMKRSMMSMGFALALAIFLVYVIMASSFESLLHPIVILASVPLASIGSVLVLSAMNIPISVVVLIGAIVLSGVVVNNAIVLVDTINRSRAKGMERIEATIAASKLRLRPILITTLTTALGLLPLALGYGSGSEIQQPLAVTIIAGLVSATVLTLVVIPCVYLVLTQHLERAK